MFCSSPNSEDQDLASRNPLLFLTYYALANYLRELGTLLPLIAVLSKFISHLPQGFETTGISIIVLMSNAAHMLRVRLTSMELQAFEIKPGYEDRLLWPLCVNSFYIGVLLLCTPALLCCKVSSQRAGARAFSVVDSWRPTKRIGMGSRTGYTVGTQTVLTTDSGAAFALKI